MNKIKVADILDLDIFKSARLLTGKNGLDNEIRYVNVYDNPLEDDKDISVPPDDVYLSSLYLAKNDPGYLDALSQKLVSYKASAFIIFDRYIKEIPKKYIDFFDNANIPVVILDYHISYSVVISRIIELRLEAEQRVSVEEKLTAIVSQRTSSAVKIELIEEINPNFQNNVIALFALDKTFHTLSTILNLCNNITADSRAFAAEYRNGVIIVLSFSDSRLEESEQAIQSVIEMVHQFLPNSAIGVSNILPLQKLGVVISQSYTALSAGCAGSGEVIRYDQLGIARILLDLGGNPALENFYKDMTTPILHTDAETGSQLFETMLCFAENDMDYKKTAVAMFVHVNTIRYRINKIKELIPYGMSEVDFHDTLSMTYKIYRIKTF